MPISLQNINATDLKKNLEQPLMESPSADKSPIINKGTTIQLSNFLNEKLMKLPKFRIPKRKKIE